MPIKKLAKKKNYRKVLNNISWLFFDKVLRLGVGLIVGVWFARYLGSEAFGLWNYLLAIITIAGILPVFGLSNIIINELVKTPEEEKYILGSALFLRLILSVITFLGTIACGYQFFGIVNGDLILLTILSFTFFFQSFDVIDYYFQSKVESKYVVYSKNISFLLFSALKVYFIIIGSDIISFAYLYSFELFLSAVLLIIFFSCKQYSLSHFRVDKIKIRKFLNEGWPLLISSISIILYMKIDQVMINLLVDSAELGNYSVAVKISEIWYMVPIIITSSLIPSIIQSRKNDINIFNKRLQNLYIIMTWSSLIFAFFISFISEPLILFLYKLEYIKAANILTLHVWAGIFVSTGVVSSQYLIIENKQKVSLYRTLIGLFSNLILNLCLIPIYHGVGAAVATIISYFLSVFSIVLFRNTRDQSVMMFKSFFPVFAFAQIQNILKKGW